MFEGLIPQSSRQHFYHDLAVYVGQSKIETLKAVRQPFVVQAHQAQDRRLEVVDMNAALDDVIAQVVGLAVRVANMP